MERLENSKQNVLWWITCDEQKKHNNLANREYKDVNRVHKMKTSHRPCNEQRVSCVVNEPLVDVRVRVAGFCVSVRNVNSRSGTKGRRDMKRGPSVTCMLVSETCQAAKSWIMWSYFPQEPHSFMARASSSRSRRWEDIRGSPAIPIPLSI
jgi:hypothetical protein